MDKYFQTKNGYILRFAEEFDAQNYYAQNFDPLNKEVARLTGSKENFSKDEVISFFLNCINNESHYHFLIISPDNRIIGESVINEINKKTRSANFRICIFQPNEQSKGLGTWATEKTRDFAFEKLGLHRLSLDVFSFNTRAENCYLKAGFRREGILRDAIFSDDKFADDVLMSILENEWREIKARESCQTS